MVKRNFVEHFSKLNKFVRSHRLILHLIDNFLISQLNLLSLQQKGSFRKLPLFKGDENQ